MKCFLQKFSNRMSAAHSIFIHSTRLPFLVESLSHHHHHPLCYNDTQLRPSPPCLPSCLIHLLHPPCHHFLPPHLPSSRLIHHCLLNHLIWCSQHHHPGFDNYQHPNRQSWAGFHFGFLRGDKSSGGRCISPNTPLRGGGFGGEGESSTCLGLLPRILKPFKFIASMCKAAEP